MRRPGIRWRVAGGSALIAILAAVAAGIVVDAQITRIERESTAALLHSDIEPYAVAARDEPADALDRPGPGQLIAVIDDTGVVRLDTLPASITAGTNTASSRRIGGYVVLSESVKVRGGDWIITAAVSAAGEDAAVAQMRTVLIAALAVIVLAAAGSAWALTSAALSPVERLRRSAESLAESEDGALLPVHRADDEIAHLAHTLNDLISRLRAAADRERELVGDASHELRTPLAILRTRLEVARREASSIEQLTGDIAEAERMVERMSALVSSLLALSRAENGEAPVADAGELIAVIESYPKAVVSGSREADFAIDGVDLRRMLDNLVANARAAGAGSISITAAFETDGLRLRIEDDGGGMDPAFVPRAFDRFAREDASRARGEGAGLGLAIVRAIVVRAGGTVTLENEPGVGLAVVVELPPAR